MNAPENQLLRLMPGLIRMPALSGSRILAECHNFNQVDDIFKKSPWNGSALESPLMFIGCYELYNNAMLMQMFGWLPGYWDEKVMSQDQIVELANKRPDLWRDDSYSICFLIKSSPNVVLQDENIEEHTMIARVSLENGGLIVRHYEIGSREVWRATFPLYIIAPVEK